MPLRYAISSPKIVSPYTEDIGQCVRYIIELQRESFSDNTILFCQKSIKSGPYFPKRPIPYMEKLPVSFIPYISQFVRYLSRNFKFKVENV